VGVPSGPGGRREVDGADPDARGLLAPRDAVDPDVSGKPLRWAFRGRRLGLDVHGHLLTTCLAQQGTSTECLQPAARAEQGMFCPWQPVTAVGTARLLWSRIAVLDRGGLLAGCSSYGSLDSSDCRSRSW